MLVGNKIDKSGRQIAKEEGADVAKAINAHFVEVSAQTGEGV